MNELNKAIKTANNLQIDIVIHNENGMKSIIQTESLFDHQIKLIII